MRHHVVLEAVNRFFASVDDAGLKLPTGWFGRPFDDWHHLTSARSNGNALFVELDNQLRLTFFGPVRAEEDGRTLRLTGFTRLEWEWFEFDAPIGHQQEFGAGIVELIGRPE